VNDNELRDAIADVCDPLVHFVASDGLPAIRTREPAEIADAVLDVVRPEIELHVEVAAAWMSDFAATTAERERVLLGIIRRQHASRWQAFDFGEPHGWYWTENPYEFRPHAGDEPMSGAEVAVFEQLAKEESQ
jgi:hypothetical protein